MSGPEQTPPTPSGLRMWGPILGLAGVLLALALIAGCLITTGTRQQAAEEERSSASRAAARESASSAEARESARAAEAGTAQAAAETAYSRAAYELQVTGIERASQLGAGTGYEMVADGEFVLVHFTLTNHSPEPAPYSAQSFTLIDADSVIHRPGNAARQLVIFQERSPVQGELGAGSTAEFVLAYDVPEGTVPASLTYDPFLLAGVVPVTAPIDV